ncbi:hypothetical protein B9J78_06585 [bacterium Unc6]|nr:hypothetical protein [bacterium Unc6]
MFFPLQKGNYDIISQVKNLFLFFLFLCATVVYLPSLYNAFIIKVPVVFIFLSAYFWFARPELNSSIGKNISVIFLALFVYSVFSLYGNYLWAGWEYFRFLILCVLCFVAGATIKDRDFIKKRLLPLFLLCAFLIACFAIFQYSKGQTPVSFVGNRNLSAETIVITFPFLLYFFIKPRTFHFLPLTFYFLLCVLFLFAISTAESFIAWGILGVSVFIFISLVFSKKMSDFFIFLGCGVCAVCAVFLTPVGDVLIKAFFSNIRLMIWAGVIEMILAKPWTGFGIGRFPIYYQEFRLREYFLHPNATFVTDYAHNEFLHTASEMGLLGVVLFAGIIIICFLSFRSIFTLHRDEKILTASIIASVASGILIGMLEQWLRFIPVALFFWFLLGVLYSFKIQKSYIPVPAKVLSIVCLVLSLTYIPGIISQHFLFKGYVFSEKHKSALAIDNFKKAIRYDRNNIHAQFFLGNEYLKKGLLNDGIRELKKAGHIWPDFSVTGVLLGSALLGVGKIEEAKTVLKRAEYINPYNLDVLTLQADIARVAGDKTTEQMYKNRINMLESKEGLSARLTTRRLYKKPLNEKNSNLENGNQDNIVVE